MKKVIQENTKSRLRAVLSSCLIIACVSAGIFGCADPIKSSLLEEIKEEVEAANTPKTYTVTYLPNGATGGSVPVDPSAYQEGERVTVLGNVNFLTKTGETFIGWAEHEDGSGERNPGAYFLMGSANVTLYARWTALPTFTVTFDSKGGSAVAAQIVEENGTADLPIPSPTWAGYTFGGWYQDEGYLYEWVFSTPITSNHTLYAKWTANDYTVTFDAEGGTPVASEQVTFGSAYPALATATRLGYAFGGWWTGDNGTGSQVIGGSTTVATASNHTLYAKWTTMETLWARTTSAAPAEAKFLSTAVAPDGSVYCAGYIRGIGTFGFGNGVTATGSNANRSILLVKYDASGTAQWARTVDSGTNESLFNSVAVDESGYVYAAGCFQTYAMTYNFGYGVEATGVGAVNALLVRYSSEGITLWAKSPSAGNNVSEFKAVAVVGTGYVYVAGYISNTVTYNFGSGAIHGTSMYSNALLVKYSTHEGTVSWASTVIGGDDASTFTSVAVDAGYNVLAAGSIGKNTLHTFGPSVTAQGSYASGDNAVLVRYNSSGAAIRAKTVSDGDAASIFNAIAVDSGNNVYAAGKIFSTGSFAFDTGVTATGGGETNPVLVKYNSDDEAQWARTKADTGTYAVFVSAAVDSSDNVYVAGTAHNGTDLGGGIVIDGANSGVNVALVRYDSSGTAQRARSQSGAANNSEFTSVALGSGGTVYAAGIMSGNSSYAFGDGVTATGAGSYYNPVLVKYEE